MESDKKEYIILIHGAWCWEKVAPLLLEKGYIVHMPNLPGHGDNSCRLEDITLEKYVNCIIEQIYLIGKPVNLVGHSMGGIVISQVAEIILEKVKSLTYITGIVLKNNETLMDAVALEEIPLVHLIMTNNELGMQVKEDTIIETFYGDCPTDELASYMSKLCIQATVPGTAPIHVSESRFGSIPRAYIECTKDLTISIKRQRAMQEDWPFTIISTLETTHSPFFSAPDELTDSLDLVLKLMLN